MPEAIFYLLKGDFSVFRQIIPYRITAMIGEQYQLMSSSGRFPRRIHEKQPHGSPSLEMPKSLKIFRNVKRAITES